MLSRNSGKQHVFLCFQSYFCHHSLVGELNTAEATYANTQLLVVYIKGRPAVQGPAKKNK
uniref:Programmed cell death 11 n=1 Tax=Taeniopygia guttata TaxID=59729 RepID=A0A674HUK2_TAEGU